MKEAEIYKLLDKYEINHPKYKLSKDEKLSFDTFPCVLKIHSNQIIHKTDVGGVITNIKNNQELNKAKKEILTSIKKYNIKLDEIEFIIEEQLNGIELFIGGIHDKIFDEVILFGSGGVMVEVYKDICYIDTFAKKDEIKIAINSTKLSKIFPEFRGKKYDINIVIKTIQKFQKMLKKENIKEFDINPLLYTDKGIFAVDARIKTEVKNIQSITKKQSLFENEKIAIIGATDKKEKVGYSLAKNALKSKSKIYFVNPKLSKLFDKKVYKTSPKVDTAVIAIPQQFVINTIKDLSKKGTINFIIISAGFKEAGNLKAEKELTNLAKNLNINIVGPNCLGIYNDKKQLNLTFAKSKIYSGKIGLISQSGAVLTALIDKASHYKIGFSHIISMGNMADFSFANAINELNTKDNCEVISIYAEGVQNGKAFLKAIRNSKKPILLFKSGKSELAKKAAFSHTGNIAGNYEMLINLARNAGADIVNSIETLIFTKKIENILIVTNAGGPGTILTDLIASKQKTLLSLDTKTINKLNKVLPSTWSHNNPIDIIGDATAKRYKNTLDITTKLADLVFVIITPQFMTNSEEIAEVLLNYNNVIPILLGKDSFIKSEKILKNTLYFNSLEEAVKILS